MVQVKIGGIPAYMEKYSVSSLRTRAIERKKTDKTRSGFESSFRI